MPSPHCTRAKNASNPCCRKSTDCSFIDHLVLLHRSPKRARKKQSQTWLPSHWSAELWRGQMYPPSCLGVWNLWRETAQCFLKCNSVPIFPVRLDGPLNNEMKIINSIETLKNVCICATFWFILYIEKLSPVLLSVRVTFASCTFWGFLMDSLDFGVT